MSNQELVNLLQVNFDEIRVLMEKRKESDSDIQRHTIKYTAG